MSGYVKKTDCSYSSGLVEQSLLTEMSQQCRLPRCYHNLVSVIRNPPRKMSVHRARATSDIDLDLQDSKPFLNLLKTVELNIDRPESETTNSQLLGNKDPSAKIADLSPQSPELWGKHPV